MADVENMDALADRRRDLRMPLLCACKVLDPRSGKYLPATTIDSSVDGLQIRLERDAGIGPGDRLLVGLPAGGGLIRRADLVDFDVVRAMRSPGGHVVLGLSMTSRADAQRRAA